MSRFSAPLALALVLLMTMPIHTVGAAPAAAAPSPSVLPSSLPSAEGPADGPTTPVAVTEGAPPAVYPSDEVGAGTTGTGPGPVPMLSSAIDRHGFRDAWAQGYQGQGVTAAVIDQGVDFGHPDLNSSYAVESVPGSPYYRWPIAFDPKSMAAYLKTGYPDGTWYANTTVTGPGPFEITHTIKVDGTNDFGQVELVGTDPRGDTASSGDGVKLDYDLTDLYMTRDSSRWYFGFSSYQIQANETYVLLLDTDNETSGTTTVPAGKLADTNTSHADTVTDVAFSPNGQRIATVGADRYLRVWDLQGHVLFSAQAHAAVPYSVAWSPNGSWIATADPTVLIIWDAATGKILHQTQYVPGTDTPIAENAILSWSPNGTWVAAGTARYIHIIDALTGLRFGAALVTTTSQVNAVRFNPSGSRIAAGLGDNSIVVFNATWPNIQPWRPATKVVPFSNLTGTHTGPVLDLTWNLAGTQIFSGGRDGRVVLWNVLPGTSTVAASATNPGSAVTGVELRKDGLGYVSVSAGVAIPFTPPRLSYFNIGGGFVRQVDMADSMTGVDTAATDIVTSSADMSARLWDGNGNPNPNPAEVKVLVYHKSDYAIVANGWSLYSNRDGAFIHGLEIATFYRWNSSSRQWEGQSLFSVNGTQASAQFGVRMFNELSVPRNLIGNPATLSIELFSAGRAATKPQDTVPNDPNVAFKNLDFSAGSLSLGAFAYRRPGSYTIDPAIVSRSGTFHFGYHPSPVLTKAFGPIGLLVVDPATAGVYTTVYVDLNNDRHFDLGDVTLTRDSPLASLDSIDHATGGPGKDGYPDVSGGLMYYISDGTTPLPYSDRYVTMLLPANPNLVNKIPRAGDLVAFMGEFGYNPTTGAKSDHGTRIASLLVGKGLLNPPALGVAPGTKIIAVGNALDDVIASWYFAVEGYDGTPGTGDEAQVVLSPFNYPTLRNAGFDVYSRTADYLSYVYSGGRALFVAPAGEGGFGYGSIASPAASPGVLAVGRVEDGTATSRQGGGTEGSNPHYLDPAMLSGRGPSAIGVPKPDLVAVGTATSDVPLQSAPGDGTTAVASAPMTGTDVAAAVVAGAAAITYQAYRATEGRAPTADELISLLQSSANDLSYDAFVQGSGFLNVSQAVRLATGAGGLLVSPSTLLPGGYRGGRAAAYTRFITAGGSDNLTLGVENRGNAPTSVAVSDAAYTLLGSTTFSSATVQDLYSSNGDITFWMNATGISKVNGTTLAVMQIAPPVPGAWAAADLVKVTAWSDVDRLVWNLGTTFVMNYSYTLTAMDWQINASNWAGLPYGPFPAPAAFPQELNTITKTAHVANDLEVRVARPAASVKDGLVFRLGETLSGSGLANVPWNFTVELFRRTDWGWVSPPAAPVPLAPHSSANLTVRIDVPAGTVLGLYEGFLLVTDIGSGRTTAVPVVVNVGTTGTDFRLGGSATDTALYDPSRFFGGNDFTMNSAGTAMLRPYMGDWRYYYVDLPDNGMFENPRGLKLVIDLRWLARFSDLDIQVYSRGVADLFATNAPDRYGPAPLTLNGKTDDLTTPVFKTATNQSEEVLTVDLKAGLNLIAIHVTRLRGNASEERAAGVAGWARVRPNVDVSTPNLAGEAQFTFLTSLDLPGGLRASAVGPATTTSFENEPIPQDWQSWWNFPNFGEYLWRGSFNYTLNITKALILEVNLQGASDVSDLDLGVFRDMNGNGKLDLDEVKDVNSKNRGGNDWYYSAGPTANENVKWLNPPDGQYFIKVLGFTVNANPGHFNLDISVTLATGKGYEIPQAPKPAEIVAGTETGLPRFTAIDFTMAWDFPGDTEDGDYGGAVLLGFPNAPGILVIPVSVGIDRVPPQITGFSIAALNGRLDAADNRTTTDRSPTLTWTIADPTRGELDWTKVAISLDGQDVTSDASISIDLTTNALGAWGFWEGTISYVPRGLTEKDHEILFTVGDLAGNLNSTAITLVLDTTAPPLAIQGPALRFTTGSTATIAVTSQPGVSVSLGGPWILLGPSGQWTTSVSLSPGENVIRATAADWFGLDGSGNLAPGNSRTATITVIRDNIAPRFARAPAPDATTTRADGTTIRGTVQDYIDNATAWAASDITLTVAGARTAVGADGTFAAAVSLAEGANPIEVRAVDLAGNAAVAWANVTRDTQAPDLTVNPLPAQVTTGFVNVSGTTDRGAVITINGIVVPLTGPNRDRFGRDVPLSGGDNVIVVRAADTLGNLAEQRFSVQSVAEPTPLWQWISIGATIGVVAFLFAYLIGRNYMFAPEEAPPYGPEEAAGEEVSAEELPPTEAAEGPPGEPGAAEAPEEAEGPAEDEFAPVEEPSAPPPEDPRVARLREAYDAGKISREVFEANLKRLTKGK